MKIKRILASLIVTSMILPLIPINMVEALGAKSEFYSSFEQGEENTFIENKILDSSGMASALTTSIGSGPSSKADPVYGNSNRGWDGTSVLRITGTHPSSGSAYSTNVIYDDLDILVSAKTQLSYVMLPNYERYESFDWEFTSQYIGIDVEFSDGTLLSKLGGVDQYGHGLTGLEQGSNKHLYSKQWNLVKSNIGEVANNKTIKKILITYNKPSNDTSKELSIEAYLDCLSIKSVDTSPKETPVEYANIFAGNNDKPLYSRGLQWPGVMTPNAFNIWCPSNTPVSKWLGTSFTNDRIWTPYPEAGITHFTTSHQASAWIGDFGRFQFMANTNYDPANGSIISPDKRRTQYDKETMIANPSYFSVDLSNADDSPAKGVKMELSPTDHAASVRFTYPSDSTYVNVVLDSFYSTYGGSITFDGKTFTAVVADNTREGRSRNMYVYGEFDQTPTSSSKAYSPTSNAKAIINFANGTTSVTMNLATSFISAEQAKKNLELEIPSGTTFNDVKKSAANIWNDLMGTVEVEGASEEEKVALYSNMYRLYADPLSLSENTGTAETPLLSYSSPYSGSSSSPSVVEGPFYYNNGFWDTFRGSWSAYQLLTPDYSTQMLNGIVQHYKDSNWVARWLAPAGRDSMVGTSSDIIFGDAITKGINFDYENAYKASLKNASVFAPYALSGNEKEGHAGRAGMNTAPFLGYTTRTINGGKGTSWALDNYLNDYGVSKLAEKLGYEDEAIYFENTAQNYVNLWNYGNGGWFIGKNSDGTWRYDEGLVYSDTASNSVYNRSISDYEETNGYTMTWQALQDVQGLINLYGGKENFTERLDNFFADETQYSGGGRDYVLDHYDSKMGQYGHSNQPDHHITYMYSYAGQPYKTQALTREILDRVYSGYSFDQGFPGDADNGEMAGWYIMSMLGFYPFSSGTDGYIITSPMHEKTTLNLPSGKLEIIANNNSDENVYIQSMTIDGKPYNQVFITYKDLINAKEIKFEMGSKPSDWACESTPPSITDADDDSVPNPLKDFTTSGVSIVDSVPANDHKSASAYVTNLSNAKPLFDNDSFTPSTFTSAEGSIYYYFPSAKKVEMITLTSATLDSVPNAFSLYGSNDGTNWQLLDNRTDVKYDWEMQTKPFAIKNDSEYNYYRLDLSAAKEISLSEVELMGYPTDITDYPSTVFIEKEKYTFDVIVDNSVTAVRFRDTDSFNIVTPDSVSEAVLNEDGTKTISIVMSTEADSTYITAMDSAGNEITASRKTINLLVSDKTALQALVDECKDLKKEDYKDDTWAAFEYQLEKAKALLENDKATQTQIDNMCTLMSIAKSILIPVKDLSVDKTLLNALIPLAQKAIDNGEVANAIQSVQNEFNKAFSEAQALLYFDDVTQDEVDKAVYALSLALNRLGFIKGDKEALQGLHDLLSKVNLDYYESGAAKEAFKAALSEAETVIDYGDAMQEEVDNAFKTLHNAYRNLVPLDRSKLKSEVETSENIFEELHKYVEAGKAEFEKALTDAKTILDYENATQADIEAARIALATARANLRYKADKDLLAKRIARAASIELSLYTDESVAVLNEVLEVAKTLLDDDTLSEDDQNIINDTCKKILEAIDDLQLKDEKVSSDIPSSSESSSNSSDTESSGNSSSSESSGNSSDTESSGNSSSSDKSGSSEKSKSADNDNSKAKVAKTGDEAFILLLAMTTLCLSIIVIYKRKKANK